MHKSTKLITAIFAIASSAFIGSAFARDEFPDADEWVLLNDIEQSIAAVAKKHHIQTEQALDVLKRSIVNGRSAPMYGKGGVSIVRDHVSIINASPTNSLNVSGTHWNSDRGRTRELVVVSNHEHVTSISLPPEALSDDMIFIFFNGEQIRTYDWKRLSGFTTLRRPAEETK